MPVARLSWRVVEFGGEHFHRGEVAEGEVDPLVVVVDRLGEVDHANPLAPGGQRVLEELELGRRGQRVVAADRDQGVHVERPQGVVGHAERGGTLRVGHVRRVLHRLARIGPGGADHDARAYCGRRSRVRWSSRL